MRCRRSPDHSHAIPLIDRTPINPLDPIAQRAAVARRAGQGRRPVFRVRGTSSDEAGPENASRRRSLVLDRSEHDGRLMAYWNGGFCAALPPIMAMMTAFVMISGTTAEATAESPFAARQTRAAVAAPSSDPWAEHVTEAAKRFAIPERWIHAVMAIESRRDRTARSPKGAIGLMQIMPTTWDELRARYGLGNDPWQPRDNILAGAAYLREMHDRYGSIVAMLAAYNAGPKRYDALLANGRALPAETVDYVAKITTMIGGATPVMRFASVSSRPAWSRAPLFVGPPRVPHDDGSETADHPSDRPLSAPTIVDLSALAPPSYGLFVRRPGAGGERR